ncbi:MAG: TPM domain-containing protein [Bacteroidetes bacterium]|nr:TPM domain-containing protein [Bacteroidota bacterium]
MKQTIISFRYVWIIIALVFSQEIAIAQDIPPRPDPPRLVNDFTGTLSSTEVNALEYKLVAFNDTTSNQIAVVLVNSLNGMDKAEFADRIGESWKVGQKAFDNGIVVLVKPKKGNENGEVWIAIGYGLEGAIPDATVNRIIDIEMIPRFRENDYYGALDQGTNVLMGLAAGEFSSDEYASQSLESPLLGIIPLLLFIFVIFLIFRIRNRSHSVGKDMPFWTALLLGSMLSGKNSHSGNWGSFRSGGGGFGGGGGGGFGGFGGGSFGGGGAGGSW